MKIIVPLIVLTLVGSVMAADVTLDWQPVDGATGYKIAMSRDYGVTWEHPVTVSAKPYIYKDVPETFLVLFKVAAYNDLVTAWNDYAFAAYDHRARLKPPPGIGIK